MDNYTLILLLYTHCSCSLPSESYTYSSSSTGSDSYSSRIFLSRFACLFASRFFLSFFAFFTSSFLSQKSSIQTMIRRRNRVEWWKCCTRKVRHQRKLQPVCIRVYALYVNTECCDENKRIKFLDRFHLSAPAIEASPTFHYGVGNSICEPT